MQREELSKGKTGLVEFQKLQLLHPSKTYEKALMMKVNPEIRSQINFLSKENSKTKNVLLKVAITKKD